MKTITKFAIGVIAAVCIITVVVVENPENRELFEPEKTKGRITGSVYFTKGHVGAAGVNIEILKQVDSEWQPQVSSETDESGNYSIEIIEGKTITLDHQLTFRHNFSASLKVSTDISSS